MSRNIKEIGKELMGKSLNSFHRRTGLTQLEKNNNIQDGILDGILSQVDDAYIEKTEQSNVIHLDGSGDGVVVLDGIEGNTMVNLLNFNDIGKAPNCNCLNINSDKKSLSINTSLEFDNRYQYFRVSNLTLYSNKEYTFVCNITKNTSSKTFEIVPYSSRHTNRKGTNGNSSQYLKVGQTGIHKYTFTMVENDIFNIMYADSNAHFNSGEVEIINPMILEGDWSDKEIPASYFEGLQSSFEEKVNDEGKYEIEILSRNKNLIDKEYFAQQLLTKSNVTREMFNGKDCLKINNNLSHTKIYFGTNDNENKVLRMSCYTSSEDRSSICHYGVYLSPNTNSWSNTWGTEKYNYVEIYNYVSGRVVYIDLDSIQVEYETVFTNYEPHKQNKIKLLINEPLRGVGNLKDRFVLKNNKLMVERFYKEVVLNGTEDWSVWSNQNNETTLAFYCTRDMQQLADLSGVMCDNFIVQDIVGKTMDCIDIVRTHYLPRLRISKSKLITQDTNGLKQWLQNNPTKILFQVIEPYYEEVLNEYGEPIILEGYENGTIYIDSTIVPTTTVRYTPKMESMKAVKEVNNNNIMLINDINESIIPYMMEIDFMIMEKEMATMSHNNNNNIRIIGEKSMTSMQKRTKEMLERLIKGKSLTEQECKDRVVLYLSADKITSEQAEELMIYISEIYA